MKKRFLILSFLFLFLSCSKKEEMNPFPFDQFVFSSAGLHHVNSIKFTKSDTVYFRRIYPEPTQNSYAILKISEREKLNNLCKGMNFAKFDNVYAQENLCDGQAYLLNLLKEGKNKEIFLYGHVVPKELKVFIDSLGEIKSKLKFIPTRKMVNFGDLSSILPPPPPPMPIKKGS